MRHSPLILCHVLNAFDLCSDQSRGPIKGKSFDAHIDNGLPFFPLFFGRLHIEVLELFIILRQQHDLRSLRDTIFELRMV